MHTPTPTAPTPAPADVAATQALGRLDPSALDPSAAASPRTARTDLRYSSHGRAALAGALGDGLMPDEVRRILAGRRVADAFPVWRGESPSAYASRAVAEMFAAYLS